MTVVPKTKYARSGDVNIAYQIAGEGPIDLVYVPGWVSNIETRLGRPTRLSLSRAPGLVLPPDPLRQAWHGPLGSGVR